MAVYQSRKSGLHAGNSGTRFGQSRTDLGLKMVLVCLGCVINCGWSVWGRNDCEFSIIQRGTKCWKFWAVLDSPRIV